MLDAGRVVSIARKITKGRKGRVEYFSISDGVREIVRKITKGGRTATLPPLQLYYHYFDHHFHHNNLLGFKPFIANETCFESFRQLCNAILGCSFSSAAPAHIRLAAFTIIIQNS